MRLGLAGTAKNTGKTTTTAAIIQELRTRGIQFFLTSIGYDGENIDNITGLPKPKLQVEAGDIVVTAEKCLSASTASLKILEQTEIRTALGKIAVAKVMKPGLVVTAGPNKSSEVRMLSQLLRKLGPGVTIYDGALNRIAPMAETDGFVLATGASRTPDIPNLARETEYIWHIANLPTVLRAAELQERKLGWVTLLTPDLTIIKEWPKTSLLSSHDIADILAQQMEEGSYLFIPGIISENAMELISSVMSTRQRRLVLTLADPIKLLVAGDPLILYNLIQKLEDKGAFVGVLRRIPMLAVTVNPFYPEYRFESKTYQPAFVDFTRLQVTVQKNIRVPVYNVVKQGAKGLVDIIMANAKVWESPDTVYF